MSDFIKAANGTMVPSESVQRMRHIYEEVLNVIRPLGEKDTIVIMDALINSMMFYAFNVRPKIKLDEITDAINLLHNWWEKGDDDTCSKCGGLGTVKGTACVCDSCGNIIWGI